MKGLFLKIILIFSVIMSSCSKEKLYSDLESLSGEGVIEIGTQNVSGEIGKVFSKYIYVTAPNGKRVEIFGTAGVSDDQMEYAREVMENYFNTSGNIYTAKDKEIVVNSMANKKSALAFFDTQEQYEANIGKVSTVGYNIQDLYAEESWNSGNRDASYEEILHLVHNYGIAPTLFEIQQTIQKANDDAIANGIWTPWGDLPKADYEDEYVAALMDCYLGLWEGKESTFHGSYKPTSKAEMEVQDPAGHKIILDLFGDIKTVR